ncbi:MAG: carbohydrate kinase family protein [Acidimicrobiales bacterium]
MSGDVVMVVVVGDLMVDVVVVPAGPLAHGSDTPATVRSTGGGSAANTACWLAWRGRAVRLVAAVGDDGLAQAALDDLRSAGVRFAGPVVPEAATGTCVVLVDEDGQRTMLPDRGANDRLPADAAVPTLADRPAWLHLSGYTLLGDGSRAAGRRALEAARAAGIPTSVDASSAAPLAAVGADRFLDWVEGIDVLFANDDELAALGGLDAAASRVGTVVVKHGPDGASWISPAGRHHAPSVADRVVDTVGAGDAFDAGYIDALLQGGDPTEALRAASETAAAALARFGARPDVSGA